MDNHYMVRVTLEPWINWFNYAAKHNKDKNQDFYSQENQYLMIKNSSQNLFFVYAV